jgi:carbonic anhydrase/acetyltransferase-like protein (isoleucine patch superfamily)
MVMGSPGKVIRELNDEDLKLIQLTIDTYYEKGKQFAAELNR